MSGKRKAGRPPGGTKGSVLSVRISPEMRTLLELAARKNKRRLSREVQARLDYAEERYKVDRPPHIKALSSAVAIAAAVIEEETERPWNKDQYTSQNLAKTIGLVIADFTQPGEVSTPPKVIEKAKYHFAGEAYPTYFAEEKARGISALLRLARKPQIWPPYHDFETEFWKIQRDLKLRRRK